MDERLKQRLVGAAVLGAVVVVFAPMVLDRGSAPEDVIEDTPLPPRPEPRFQSRVVPLNETPPPAPVAEPPEPAPVEPELEPPEVATAAPAPPVGSGEPAAGVEPAPAAGGAGPAAEEGAPRDQRVGLRAWAVQLGSFADHGNAIALRDRLRAEGFPAFVETVAVHERPMTRVFVGPELLRGNALETLEKLKKTLDLEGGQVVRYPRG